MKFVVTLATLFEILGLAGLVVGAYLFDWRAAVLVGSVALGLVGAALDRPGKPSQ